MIRLSAKAISEFRRQLAAAGCEGGVVRIGVRSGGCAGTKYAVEFAGEPGEDDRVFEQDGLRVACGVADLASLDGLSVDYVEAVMGGGFRYDNPNATTECACGQSFDTA